MIRIGIIGSENSHAHAFSTIFNCTDKYPDIEVVGVYGEDPQASQKIHEECKVPFIADSATDMLGRVDAMMVTSRNGALHPGYARPYIEAGLPMFIDKPIANDGTEAYALLMLAQEKGVPVLGGSSVKLVDDVLSMRGTARAAAEAGLLYAGHVWAPVTMENPYGNFYFYSAHLIESAMAIFGFAPKSVSAQASARGVEAMLNYEGYVVHLSYMDGGQHYGATVLTKDTGRSCVFDTTGGYALEVEHFVQMLRTGKSTQTLEELVAPIYALNAIEKAYITGQVQPVVLPK